MTHADLLMVKGVVGTKDSNIPYCVDVYVSPLWWMSKARMRRLEDTLNNRMAAGVLCRFVKSWWPWMRGEK